MRFHITTTRLHTALGDLDIYSNGIGIYFDTGGYATVTNSDFYSNLEDVRFTGYSANGSLFEDNYFYNNTSAALFFANDAHNNIIRSNDFYNNAVGVKFRNLASHQSYNNTFYQNSFVGNTIHAQVDSVNDANAWDNGYPGGGNYWDDYSGADVFSGAAQNVPGRDGIGDTAKVIAPTTNVDRYPLMNLFATNNGPKDVGNLVTLTASTLLKLSLS